MAADRKAAQERLSELQSRMVALPAAPAAPAEPQAAPAAPPAAKPAPAAPAAPAAAAPKGALAQLAAAAVAAGRGAFVFPEGGARVGARVRLFYDRCSGPLPRDVQPKLKAGLNAWEEVVTSDMRRAEELAGAEGHEWWEVEVELPDELFRFDYVVFDSATGAVDNNHAKVRTSFTDATGRGAAGHPCHPSAQITTHTLASHTPNFFQQ
jgi:hypothetical protein